MSDSRPSVVVLSDQGAGSDSILEPLNWSMEATGAESVVFGLTCAYYMSQRCGDCCAIQGRAIALLLAHLRSSWSTTSCYCPWSIEVRSTWERPHRTDEALTFMPGPKKDPADS